MQAETLYLLHKELTERFKPGLAAARSLWDGLSVLAAELQAEADDRAYDPALRRLKTETLNLPNPDRVRTILMDETKKVRVKDSDQRDREWTKTKEPRQTSGGMKPVSELTTAQLVARDEHAKAALMCLRSMQTDLPPDKKLEFFMMMEQRYPGIGWGSALIDQQKWYKRKATRPHWRPISEASLQFRLRVGYKETTEE